jgi:hypothetical protein
MEDLKNREFITNPNLKFKSLVREMKCCFGINDIFDIYYSHNENNELYLISADANNTISITRLRDNKLVKSLGDNNGSIKTIRHFYNKKNKTDYFVASFKGSFIKVWDLTNNYNLKHSIQIDYSENTIIYSCFLYFPENDEDYLITSSNERESNDYTKIYSFANGSLINNMEDTNRSEIYYLLLWSKNDKDDFLIECSNQLVVIHDLKTKKLVRGLHTNNTTIHNSACIIRKDEIDYLYVGNINGIINIWDLNTFQLKGNVTHRKSYFYHLINWSNKFILVAEKFSGCIIVIDTTSNRVITVITNKDEIFVNSLKKIIHPDYGESLLSSDFSNKIYLWCH